MKKPPMLEHQRFIEVKACELFHLGFYQIERRKSMEKSEYEAIISILLHEIKALNFRLETYQEENNRLNSALRALKKEENA